ncbi:MAG TPA: ComEA family DNA-binding protein [Candidatus Hydrogenedentes bacterium]|nr:ComEA family DNA-binding protein [Candidatus Hydrogenedentota bacterium]HPG70301.1 ComEA family DNA-binding protein [Candidatus Hydrogenedentota bacterium]
MTRKELWILLGLAAVLVSIVAGIRVYHNSDDASDAIYTATPATAAEAPAIRETAMPPEDVSEVDSSVAGVGEALTPIGVSVVGAVRRPGVYELTEGARVQDLLDAAGGPQADADLSDVNLAGRLVDETTLAVPFRIGEAWEDSRLVARRRGPTTAGNLPQYRRAWGGAPQELGRERAVQVPEAVEAAEGSDRRIDLNHASSTELETLPGIGPRLSQAIIEYRSQSPFRRVEDLEGVPGIGPKRLDALRPFVALEAPPETPEQSPKRR